MTKGTRLGRIENLAKKAWSSSLALAERPTAIPSLLHLWLARGASLYELVRLSPFLGMLKSMNLRTVIDVGSHTGEFASVVRASIPDARLICFEPLPEAVAVLRRRFRDREEVMVHPFAVGDYVGRVEFHRSTFSKSSSLLPLAPASRLHFPWIQESRRMEVDVTTLDHELAEVALDPAVLLKLDVQGTEAAVLAGATRTLASVDYVLTEVSFEELYEGQSLFGDIHQVLADRGFALAGILGQIRSDLDGRILQADALFRRRSASDLERSMDARKTWKDQTVVG